MTAPNVGDRVRITRVVEGTVERLESGADHGTRVLLRNCPTGTQRMAYGWVHYGDPEETVEVLSPVWQPGDVVIDADYRTWLWALEHDDDDTPWGGVDSFGRATWMSEDGPRRPLTLLVRGGKAVV